MGATEGLPIEPRIAARSLRAVTLGAITDMTSVAVRRPVHAEAKQIMAVLTIALQPRQRQECKLTGGLSERQVQRYQQLLGTTYVPCPQSVYRSLLKCGHDSQASVLVSTNAIPIDS